MRHKKSRGNKILGLITILTLFSTTAPANAAADVVYMEGKATGVTLDAVATAGDSIAGYLIGGIPDGMGVIKEGNILRVITNHEWSNANPIAAARASTNGMTTGSYISEMHYDLKKKSIVAGKDFMEWITWFDYETNQYGSYRVLLLMQS